MQLGPARFQSCRKALAFARACRPTAQLGALAGPGVALGSFAQLAFCSRVPEITPRSTQLRPPVAGNTEVLRKLMVTE